LFLTTCTSF